MTPHLAQAARPTGSSTRRLSIRTREGASPTARLREPVLSVIAAAQGLFEDREADLVQERDELEADLDALHACADLIESVLERSEATALHLALATILVEPCPATH